MSEDPLAPFREIAAECTEDECLSIMEDCLESDNPIVQVHVREIYARRLESLRRLREEIDHYESLYDEEKTPKPKLQKD